MSSSHNPESLDSQGQFKPSVERDEPMTTTGHQPGRKTALSDFAPKFSAKTLPPGSAPADRTFQPNPVNEVPGQANNPDVLRGHGKESAKTTAESTLIGADSAQVHTGLGHPGQGQTSSELRHDGEHHRTRQDTGLQGGSSQEVFNAGQVDERVEPSQRGLEREGGVYAGDRGDKGALGAEERIPEGAENVASEAAAHHDHRQHRG